MTTNKQIDNGMWHIAARSGDSDLSHLADWFRRGGDTADVLPDVKRSNTQGKGRRKGQKRLLKGKKYV